MSSVVQLDSITRTFPGPPETAAIRECSLTVEEGDFLTIVGPSGSGKSTLLNLVGLLDRPSSGRYLLRGRDVSSLDENTRAATRGEHIGFVFQSFQLIERRTCIENVMLADLYRGTHISDSRAAAQASLDAVGMGSRADSRPIDLSGGERQRIAIARALVGNPAILLCDEPTGNLDSRNSSAILDLFLSLNSKGATIVLITHDNDIANLGNRRVSILDGVVTEARFPQVGASR